MLAYVTKRGQNSPHPHPASLNQRHQTPDSQQYLRGTHMSQLSSRSSATHRVLVTVPIMQIVTMATTVHPGLSHLSLELPIAFWPFSSLCLCFPKATRVILLKHGPNHSTPHRQQHAPQLLCIYTVSLILPALGPWSLSRSHLSQASLSITKVFSRKDKIDCHTLLLGAERELESLLQNIPLGSPWHTQPRLPP